MTITATAQRIFRPSDGTDVEPFDAMRMVLLAYSQPLKKHRSSTTPPKGMLTVIKVAAGDNETLEAVSKAMGHRSKTLQEAASFYLQQQLLSPNKSPFQRLSLPDLASTDEIILHKRWLLKWLHPDRNANKWQSAMFQRVTDAAKSATDALESVQNTEVSQRIIAPMSSRQMTHGAHPGSHGRKPHGMPHKRVRVFQWRDVVRRLLRRLAMACVLLPLIYFGLLQVTKHGSQWSSNIQAMLFQ